MKKLISQMAKVLLIIYIATVLFLCFWKFPSSGVDLGQYFLGIRLDRYAHFSMFFPFSFLIWFAYIKNWKNNNPTILVLKLVLVFIVGLILAGFTELGQKYIFEGRSGEVLDFVADSLGIALGCLIIYIFNLVRERFCSNFEG